MICLLTKEYCELACIRGNKTREQFCGLATEHKKHGKAENKTKKMKSCPMRVVG